MPCPDVWDVLVSDCGTKWGSQPRINVEANDTGCTQLAAIAAGAANGCVNRDCCGNAIRLVNRALILANQPARGEIVLLDYLAVAADKMSVTR